MKKVGTTFLLALLYTVSFAIADEGGGNSFIPSDFTLGEVRSEGEIKDLILERDEPERISIPFQGAIGRRTSA